MASLSSPPRSTKDRKARRTSSVEFVQPLSLAAGSARARRQRRARRLGSLLRVSAVALLIGVGGGVYALISGGHGGRTVIFSNEPDPQLVSATATRHVQLAAAVSARRRAAARRRAVALLRREQSAVVGTRASSASAATSTTTSGASAATTGAPAATTGAPGATTSTGTPSAAAVTPTSASSATGTTTTPAAESPSTVAPASAQATRATDSLSVSQAAQDAAAGTLSFNPPSYLLPYYKTLSDRYGISLPVLAALSYAQSGGYSRVLAGAGAAPLAAAARASAAGSTRTLSVNVIADAATAAAQPRPELYTSASKLAASGAASTPALALQTVTQSYSTTDDVLTIAQRIGTLPASATTTATPTQRIGAMLGEANLLNGLPYVWGGGHTSPAWLVQGGYDCSGFVSAVLHAAGYLVSPETTQTLPGQSGILNGPGQYVTIYDRTVNTMTFATRKKKPKPASKSTQLSVTQATTGVHLTTGKHSDSLQVTPAAQKAIEQAEIQKANEQDNTINDEHVIINIDGHWWESGGDTGNGGAASVHPISGVNPAYLKSFNLVLHPAGL